MTSEQFVYWLQGYLEISGAKSLTPEQVEVVKDHLATVFTKVTPDRPNPIRVKPEPFTEPEGWPKPGPTKRWPQKLCSQGVRPEKPACTNDVYC